MSKIENRYDEDEYKTLLDKVYPTEQSEMEAVLKTISKIFNKNKVIDNFWLINSLIIDNNLMDMSDSERISPKFINRLFYLYKSSFTQSKRLKKECLDNDKNILKKSMHEGVNLIFKETSLKHYSYKPKNFQGKNLSFLSQTYIAYFLDYSDITKIQFIHAFLENREVIEEIFNNEIAVEEIIKGIIICMGFELYIPKLNWLQKRYLKKYLYKGNFTSFPLTLLSKTLQMYGVSPKFISIFFKELSYNEQGKIRYFTSIIEDEEFALGLKCKNEVFFNRGAFAFEELWYYIIHNEKMIKHKDKFAEEFCFKMLSDFFNINEKVRVFKGLYDYEKNEQDILVIYKKYILCFECKAEKFNEPFREPKKQHQRLEHNFKTSIQKAYEQAYRVKKVVNRKPPQCYYYDSDKEDRKKELDLKDIKPQNVLMIAVTLDDYLNLSTGVDAFLKRKENNQDYPLAIDIFSLHTILDKCLHLQYTEHQKENEYAQELFIKYCVSRTRTSQNISSTNACELDVFGAFISKTYNMGNGNVFNKSLEGCTTIFGHSFANNVLWHINQYQTEVLYSYPIYENDFLAESTFPLYK